MLTCYVISHFFSPCRSNVHMRNKCEIQMSVYTKHYNAQISDRDIRLVFSYITVSTCSHSFSNMWNCIPSRPMALQNTYVAALFFLGHSFSIYQHTEHTLNSRQIVWLQLSVQKKTQLLHPMINIRRCKSTVTNKV